MDHRSEYKIAKSVSALFALISLEREWFLNGQKLRELSTRLRRSRPAPLTEAWHEANVSALREEVGRLTRQIAEERGRQPAGPPDALTAQIDASCVRFCADYKQYRRHCGYPDDKGARHHAR